jgi:Asp-tRNA(Asn)/Glu-tRNA(Gln) amidotransferase A subunit family amidase
MALYPNEHETIEGVGRALRAGQTTCVEVLRKCFDRIEEWEPRIKAWVRVDRAGAIEQARALDEELAAGKCRGPLHGIPIGIKDIIDVRGLPTAAGFGPWRDRVADRDATIVGSLRAAGAVILGKTVTTQFAWIDPPPTRNPWNLDRTPGGSSSGSAAAVAVGMCLGAIGTQTGGSIIRPASFCGVCGFKPTFGRLDENGILPFARSLDHPGPIARSTRDLILLFHELNERIEWDWDNPFGPPVIPESGSPAGSPEQAEGWISALLSSRDRPPRLRRLRGFFDRRAEPIVDVALTRAVDALVAAGAEVVDQPDDAFDFEGIVKKHRLMMAAEAAAGHEARMAAHRDDYAPRIRALVEEGMSIPVTEYIRCNEHWQSCTHMDAFGLGRDADALLMPATIGPAPDPATTGDPAFNSPWSYLGWPAVSFPIGLSPDGLPLALQLVGLDDFSDSEVLSTASWCEDVIRRASRSSERSD